MSVTGERDDLPGGGPQRAGVPIVDLFTGMYATVSILAALHHRDASGAGQHIDLSLLDVVLAHHLFKAIDPNARVVLVGDPDQLPSVAPGNVLGDLIRCGAIATFRLTHIHRQGPGSRIVANAHRILHGEVVVTEQHVVAFPCCCRVAPTRPAAGRRG